MEIENTTFLNQMTLQDFKIMSVEALRVFLSLRKKPHEGDYETLVYRAMAAWEVKVPVNIEAEEQHRVSLNEYRKKLIIDNETFPDPLTIKKTEWISENQNGMHHWPPVYYYDIANYLKQVNIPQDLLHGLECEYKEGKGFRYFACNFVKEILWTGINENSTYCFVKCKVTPSQRTSSNPYNVWAAIKKESPGGEVASAYCSCTAGLLGTVIM